jgi:hypothetical protein
VVFEKVKPLRSILSGLCFVAALMLATRCLAHGVGNFCLGGPCIPSQETIINLYWDSSVSAWDTHAGKGLTVGEIDAFTGALLNSTYFLQLKQYHVDQILMGPTLTAGDCSATPSAAAQPANVDAAINGGINALITCIAQTNPTLKRVSSAIINVFLPPQVLNTGFCNPQPGGHFDGYHDATSFGNLSWTIIPTVPACNKGFDEVTAALSHEMVEAATDPLPQSPSGWKVFPLGRNGGDEIADLCEGVKPQSFTPFLGGRAALYWSNSDNACVEGFVMTSAPSISNASVCGSGRSMQITLRGSFGPPPWDVTSNTEGNLSLYIRARIAPPTSAHRLWWNAGSPLGASLNPLEPPQPVGFAKVTWTQGTGPGGVDEIKISGFDASYGGVSGRFIRPGDNITITVVDPDNGVTASTTVISPDVATVQYFSIAPDLVAGAMGSISGVALDGAGCPVETTINATGGTVSSMITSADGSFSADFAAPDVAGSVTINLTDLKGTVIASGTTHIHPRLDSLVQPLGDSKGGQTTVLNGLGFDTTATQVTFGGSAATVKSVAADHTSMTLTTPQSPLPKSTLNPSGAGAVSVLATVHGVVSSPIQYDYVDTGAPVIEFVDAAGNPQESGTCHIGHIRVQILNPDGTPRTGAALLSADYPAFWVPTSSAGSLGRWVTSITAGLGDVVTLLNGGPVTATDPNNPPPPASNATTESFPVLPTDLCDRVKSVDKKLSRIWANDGKLYVASPKCEGDCGGPGPATVIWADTKDLAKAQNYVSISGKTAEEIKARYEVEAVPNETRSKLISENPFVAIYAKAQGPAVFVGPMINIAIRKAATEESGPVAGGRISFALPLNKSGAYGIVRLQNVGGRHDWVEETHVSPTRRATTIEADVTSEGIYSLVHSLAANPN